MKVKTPSIFPSCWLFHFINLEIYGLIMKQLKIYALIISLSSHFTKSLWLMCTALCRLINAGPAGEILPAVSSSVARRECSWRTEVITTASSVFTDKFLKLTSLSLLTLDQSVKENAISLLTSSCNFRFIVWYGKNGDQ